MNLTPKNIEELMMSAALIMLTSSILVVALAIAYRVAVKPLLGDLVKLRTGLERRLADVEEQLRLNAAGALPFPVDSFQQEYAVKKPESAR